MRAGGKRIAEFREVTQKVVSMLSSRRIEVTQRGTDAHVQYDPKTHAVIGINLPFIPDDADDTLLDAIRGFLDHEVAHVLFTEPKEMPMSRFAKHTDLKRIHVIWNLIEDTRIEREMQKRFPGSAGNLSNVFSFMLDRVTKPEMKKARSAGANMFGCLAMPMMRAFAGQRVAQNFMDANDGWAFLGDVATVLEPFRSRVATVGSTGDATVLAKEMFDAMKEASTPPPPEGGEGKESDDEENDEQSEGKSGKGKGKPKKSESKSKPNDDKTSKSDKSEKSDEPSKGSGKSDESEDEEQDDELKGSGESERDDKEDGKEEDGDSSDSDADDGDDDGSDSGDADDESEFGDAGDTEADKDDAPVEHRGDLGEVTGNNGESKSTREARAFKAKIVERALEDLSKITDDPAAKLLSEIAAKGAKSATYLPFTTDFDRVERVKLDGSSTSAVDSKLVEVDEQMRSMVGQLQSQMRRLFAQQAQSMPYGGQRSGRIQSSSLHKLMLGDDRVFFKREETEALDTAVTLLIDNSGSMSGGRVQVAVASAYALSQTLERLGVVHEILGFSTDHGHKEVKRIYKDVEAQSSKIGRRFSRITPLVTYLYKDFHERLTIDVKRGLIGSGGTSGWGSGSTNVDLEDNVDGESVMIAARRLIQRREPRKIMIVLSDGQPACGGADHSALVKHLRDVVLQCETMGIEMIGIGIETTSVKTYYPKNTVITRASELPNAIMTELKKALLDKRAA